MARDPNAPHTEDPRVPPAQTDNTLFAHLLDLRDEVETAAQDAEDAILKPALLNIARGIDTLADALRTAAALERPDA